MMWALLLGALALGYLVARVRQPRGKCWDYRRTWCWYAGLIVAGVAVVGPLPERAVSSFPAHMLGHLLLGMLAPILLTLGTPVTLLLRAIPVRHARRVVRVLGSAPIRVVAHPVPAALLNTGGLFLLYRSDLFLLMHDHAVVYLLVHLHVLAAGYLFTASIIGSDPVLHRPSFRYRAVVMVLAFGAHAVLAKSLIMYPPAGIGFEEAERASKLMYYGGDAVDAVLIVFFCHQWYRATAPRTQATALEGA
jgi:putative membrane protein